MRHEDLPRNIPDLVSAARFPVYGLVNNPFDLFVCSYGLGISPLSHLAHIEFEYRIFPHSSQKYPRVRIISFDEMRRRDNERELIFNVKDLCEDKKVSDQFLRQVDILIAGDIFSGDIIYQDQPFQATAFVLQSEKTVLLGKAHGFSYETIFRLLEGLQVINDQDKVIEQYQREKQEFSCFDRIME